MSISMDQSLEVFRDIFYSFYTFGIQKYKNQRFWWKSILGAFLSNRSACVYKLVQVI